MRKIMETGKEMLKVSMLSVITIIALSSTSYAEKTKFDPATYSEEQAKKYEAQLLEEDKNVQENLKSLAKECKIRTERGKKYRAFLDRNPDLNKTRTNSIVKSCQKRIEAVCGAIQKAQKEVAEEKAKTGN